VGANLIEQRTWRFQVPGKQFVSYIAKPSRCALLVFWGNHHNEALIGKTSASKLMGIKISAPCEHDQRGRSRQRNGFPADRGGPDYNHI
jgi:hypothetical protein